MAADFPRGPFGHSSLGTFYQPDFERALLGGLQRFANVSVVFEHAVTGVEQRPDGVAVEVATPDGLTRIEARYVVACENAPAKDGPARLTARERQVVALYRLGADAKLIAYELGLAHATVRVLLSRAAHRLGVRSPRALRDTSD